MHTRLVKIHALSCNKPPNSKFEYTRSLQLLHQVKMEISYEDVFQLLNTGTYPSNCTSNRRRAIRRRASKFSLKSLVSKFTTRTRNGTSAECLSQGETNQLAVLVRGTESAGGPDPL